MPSKMVTVRVRFRVRFRHERTIQDIGNLSARTGFAAISGPRGLFLVVDHIFSDSPISTDNCANDRIGHTACLDMLWLPRLWRL